MSTNKGEGSEKNYNLITSAELHEAKVYKIKINDCTLMIHVSKQASITLHLKLMYCVADNGKH